MVLIAAAAGLAGCGSSSSSSSAAAHSPTTAGPPPAAEFVLGSWHGRLYEHGLAPFLVAVTVRSLTNSAENRVRYSGIDCGGNWTYLGTSGATVRFREMIDTGRSTACKGVGEVTLTRAGDRLGYRFAGGGVVSRGLLARG